MKEYNKEKLHEYAKELFALCLKKGLDFEYSEKSLSIEVWKWGNNLGVQMIGQTYISKHLFNSKIGSNILIWELIEKVKQL